MELISNKHNLQEHFLGEQNQLSKTPVSLVEQHSNNLVVDYLGLNLKLRLLHFSEDKIMEQVQLLLSNRSLQPVFSVLLLWVEPNSNLVFKAAFSEQHQVLVVVNQDFLANRPNHPNLKACSPWQEVNSRIWEGLLQVHKECK